MTQGERTPAVFFTKDMPSCLSEVDEVCDDVRTFLEGEGLAVYCFSLELMVREAVNNAILHGNCRNNDKRVTLDLSIGKKWIRAAITDEGAGFNWRRARRKPMPDATSISGRGLCIIASYADRLTYNRLGNRVTVWIDKAGAKR